MKELLIVPHSNNGRSFLFVGGIPLEAIHLRLTNKGHLSYYVNNIRKTKRCSAGIDSCILGTIHTEGNALVFSEGFDPEVLVEKLEGLWRDYAHESDVITLVCKTVEDSVLSLLESLELPMINEYGEKEPERGTVQLKGAHGEWDEDSFMRKCINWRTSEDKRHKFKVAVIEVNQ